MDTTPNTVPAGAPREVRVLPPELANRIAAGEVVERPASVLKELCENALDAQAGVITAEIEGGGVDLIRVRDDGWGIPPAQAPLALERHATSKIHTATDLDAIGTLGFRGEALPSIAAVSRFVLQTRARGEDVGTRVEVTAGAPAEVRVAGCPPGTLVEVRDLFFNTPARRKFLKTLATETAHASEAVARLALAHPSVDFRLRTQGRETITAPSAPGLRERVAQVLRNNVAEHLYDCDGAENGIRIHGLVGDPAHARGRSDSLYTFVNRRFVRDKVIHHAIGAAYLPVLDRGRFPWVVLFVEVPPEALDVNVHPAKFEVRFADSRTVHRAVEHVVAQAIQRAPWVGKARSYHLGPKSPPVSAQTGLPLPRALRSPLPVREVRVEYGSAAASDTAMPALEPQAFSMPSQQREPNSFSVPSPQSESRHEPWRGPRSGASSDAEPPPGYFGALRVVGQIDRLYIVCEGEGEIVLVDQHAAHERVNFERLRESFRAGEVRSQPLLFPVTLELSPLEAEAAEAYAPELGRMGFEVEPFGSGTVALKAVPALLSDRQATQTAQDLLGDLARVGRASALEERVDALLATVACHASVRHGDALGLQECERLLRDLDEVDFRGNCPHGRPVVLRAGFDELERGFHRR